LDLKKLLLKLQYLQAIFRRFIKPTHALLKDFHFHDLRGCWASYSKGEMVAQQKGMGHSSIVTTSGYTVPLQDDIKKMYESFQVWEHDEKIIKFPAKVVGGH
jgi:integrase